MKYHVLQVFAIEFGEFSIKFVPFAIELVAFAVELVPFSTEFPFQLNSLLQLITRMAAGENTKTWCSSCYKNLFKYNSSKQLFIR